MSNMSDFFGGGGFKVPVSGQSIPAGSFEADDGDGTGGYKYVVSPASGGAYETILSVSGEGVLTGMTGKSISADNGKLRITIDGNVVFEVVLASNDSELAAARQLRFESSLLVEVARTGGSPVTITSAISYYLTA